MPQKPTIQPQSSLNAERALDIILALAQAGPEGLSLSEIARKVGAGKSAAHRSLSALLSRGFAEPAGRYGHYRSGVTIETLARQQHWLSPQIEALRPGMTEFVRRTGLTAYLMVQSGHDAVCAEMISRFEPRQISMGIGARLPLGVGAGSLAVLSLLAGPEADQIIAANTPRYQSHPSVRPVSGEIVRGQVEEARVSGYAVNMGYYFLGQGGLGLPLRDRLADGFAMAVSFNLPLDMMSAPLRSSYIQELADCLGISFNAAAAEA